MEISEMDSLCEKIIEVQVEITELEKIIEEKKGSISAIKARVQEYFVESGREAPYRSPYGTLYIRTDLNVKQPKGESLRELFIYFEKTFGTDVAWQKMSIHNATLKAEVKDYIKTVEARGGDPVLEPLPGVEAPTQFKSLQFKRS